MNPKATLSMDILFETLNNEEIKSSSRKMNAYPNGIMKA